MKLMWGQFLIRAKGLKAYGEGKMECFLVISFMSNRSVATPRRICHLVAFKR